MIRDLVRADFKAVDKRDPVASVLGWLTGKGGGFPIVCDRGRPYGILNERAFMQSRLDARAKVERYVVGTPSLDPDASAEQALAAVADSRIRAVPVVEDGRLLGYARAADVLAAARGSLVAAAMAEEAPALPPRATVADAMKVFSASAFDALPVVDDRGRATGVLRRRALVPFVTDERPHGRQAAGGEVDDPRRESAAGYADPRFATVRPRDRFEDVAEKLRDFGCAVLEGDDGRVQGMVTPEAAAQKLVR